MTQTKSKSWSVCVFCSSSDAVEPSYAEAAKLLGDEIGRRGYQLVYGGTRVGLMGHLAQSVQASGGRVVGVIPEYFRCEGITYEGADELLVTKDLRERKSIMEKRSDAFIALPGGMGTLEETLEIVTLKQLKAHNKPIVLYNINQHFDPLLSFFRGLADKKFMKLETLDFFYLGHEPVETLDYIENYQPDQVDIPVKWF